MKKAIVFGASGFIGSFLTEELLRDPDYEEVTVVVRKNLHLNHPKLRTVIGDFAALEGLKEYIVADEVFIALGTTKANTPDQKKYYEVDHDYPVLATQIAQENGAKSVFVVTAVGANTGSSVFYVRTKGETERDIIALDLPHTHIFRPSMIMGKRKESRMMESVLIKAFSVINPLLISDSLKKYRGIEARDIAKAMIAAAKKPAGKVKIYHWQEMHHLL